MAILDDRQRRKSISGVIGWGSIIGENEGRNVIRHSSISNQAIRHSSTLVLVTRTPNYTLKYPLVTKDPVNIL